MADLTPKSPAHGLTPVMLAGVHLTEAPMTAIWSIAPYRGQTEALSAALQQAHGLRFPAPGGMSETGTATIAWSGLDQAFLMGAVPDPGLAAHAALCDQSDGWARLILEGASARAVLARLVPIDLAPAACPPGSSRRTLLGHMPTLILHRGGDGFELVVFRSMAATAVHEVSDVMRKLAARGAL
ncbi:sarcosine oxidase subunit gamma [uncultured Roseicyclus sp.]|uniref:sarcosine oxidase subunit gamma n=1 Tax=uncultured Roseicyclus sp. TaxID=543072 RepID=UPI002636EEA6|nr:sarcosine oxidase subunit gamma family protein [uncultured Roseicyclus sp.]